MKVQLTYCTNGMKIIEVRDVDDTCYPRVIGRLIKEMYDKKVDLEDIRCLDDHGCMKDDHKCTPQILNNKEENKNETT